MTLKIVLIWWIEPCLILLLSTLFYHHQEVLFLKVGIYETIWIHRVFLFLFFLIQTNAPWLEPQRWKSLQPHESRARLRFIAHRSDTPLKCNTNDISHSSDKDLPNSDVKRWKFDVCGFDFASRKIGKWFILNIDFESLCLIERREGYFVFVFM